MAIGGIDRERARPSRELECIGAVIGALPPPGDELARMTELAQDLERVLSVSS